MGNMMEKVKGDDHDHEPESDTYDIKKIYWDGDGNLRHGTSERNRDEEILQIMQTDTNDDKDWTKLWMIVPSRWVRKWLLFTRFKKGDPPGPIDMWSLLKQDNNVIGGWRPKNTLLPPSTVFGEERPGHYRRITLECWIHLVDLYGVDGYAIAVRGTPYDDLTRWRVFKDPKRIDINLLPEPVEEVVEVKEEPSAAKAITGAIAGAFGSLFSSGTKKETDKRPASAPPTVGAAPVSSDKSAALASAKDKQ